MHVTAVNDINEINMCAGYLACIQESRPRLAMSGSSFHRYIYINTRCPMAESRTSAHGGHLGTGRIAHSLHCVYIYIYGSFSLTSTYTLSLRCTMGALRKGFVYVWSVYTSISTLASCSFMCTNVSLVGSIGRQTGR